MSEPRDKRMRNTEPVLNNLHSSEGAVSIIGTEGSQSSYIISFCTSVTQNRECFPGVTMGSKRPM